ncbi:MAG: NADH-quinone oxidoreductase subunit H [Deltaproteobacteria bacterium]|nr:NADH-quinone oxidoreductase subunit H [Deltaproteobacteria bacterium]MBW2070924.1 NADH-quinone oxidoreductase subunit H [Deltaproteobacteria bacterium]
MEGLINNLFHDTQLFHHLGYVPTAAVVMFACGLAVLNFFGLMGGLFTFFERKLAGWTNARRGPNRVGPYGLLQFAADGVKLVLKEDIIPAAADRNFFKFAPYLVLLGTALSFVVIPFGPRLIISDLNVGVFYLLATGSFTVVGLIMAGWASNNKWALLGGMRSAAQIISYEIPNALAILVVVLMAGTLSMQGIIKSQAGGIQNWFLFRSPFSFLAFFIYFVSAIAEINRIPFDIPEAESELVAGYNIEYSGMRFGAFFAAEFGNIYVISAVAVTCFLGGWQVPLVDDLDSLGPLGQALGRSLSRPAVLVLLLAGALPFTFFAWRALQAFLRDVSRKRSLLRSRFIRVNSELFLLASLFAAVALLLALHIPLRQWLPAIYGGLFVYLLPFLVFFIKAMFISFVVLWWRWTLPRLRVDQLMGVCWKYLIPIGFVCLLGQGVWMCWLF